MGTNEAQLLEREELEATGLEGVNSRLARVAGLY